MLFFSIFFREIEQIMVVQWWALLKVFLFTAVQSAFHIIFLLLKDIIYHKANHSLLLVK